MRSALPLLVVLATVPGVLAAQAAWTQLTPAAAPSARAGTLGVSDGGGMLVFGGLVGNAPNTWSNELWRFDGAAWTNLTPAAGALPPDRDFYAAAWDPARSRYVLFGGRGVGTANLGDTWEWDGASWTQLAPATSPSPRQWAAMTYDVTLGKCVLFGGNTNLGGTAYVNDTWTWDGANWVQLAPATSPSLRGRGFFSYDPTRLQAIYYGGRNASTALADTWKWDGTNWTQIVTVTRPGSLGVGGLFAYGCTYDLLRDRHVVFGGTRTGATLATVWEFDGVDWLQRGTGPLASRTGPAMAFVPATGKTCCYGGFQTAFLGDTWEYQTDDFPGFLPFGLGCAGPAGTLQMTEASAAWIGQTHRTTVSNCDPFGFTLGLIGLSNAVWNGVPLPLPLAVAVPTTSPSCLLLVSPDVSNLLTVNNGVGELALPIPNDVALIGFVLHEQAVQFDLAFTFSVSAGASLTIGAR
jgi:hypothetical protein